MSVQYKHVLLLLAVILSLSGVQAIPAGAGRTVFDQFPAPGTFTEADLKKLRWIEGTWRGTGGGVPPFFERYKFENDRTLAVETLEGEKLEKVTDVTRFELKDGRFGGGSEGSRWEASSIDDKSINFVPVTKARNSFRFDRESETIFTATLDYPANAEKPARQRIYRMERWPKP
jgi:hypothetical protein